MRTKKMLIIHRNCCCGIDQARLLAPQLYKLFWGEQPPFTSIGRGGRYFFGDNRSKRQLSTSNLQMVNSTESGKFSWPVAIALVVLILAAAGVFIFWRLETWPARTIGQGTDE